MKITKILVALSFLFAVSTANAGELTVTGNMEVTYNSQGGSTTGNPLGTDRELTFSGSTELDNGVTVTVMQDTSDNLGYGDNKITFGNVAGLVDIYVGADGSPVDAIDDVTPTAYEEANGSGSGTYNDIGGLAGEMGIGIKFNLPILGAVDAKYIPKADGNETSDNSNSGDTSGAVGSGESISIKTNLADLPFVGSFLDGATLTTGYETDEVNTAANTSDIHDLTAALNYSVGNFAFGVQRKLHNEGQPTNATTDEIRYKDLAIGVSYAVNDSMSISYNTYESKRHNTAAANYVQETSAINIGYSVAGMTIGFQEASTDNANFVQNAEDDSRTLGISVAF
jgi:hypothetical protein